MPTVLLKSKLLKQNYRKDKMTNDIDRFVFGQKIGLLTKIFGCWHDDLSRPFAQGKTAYRSCLQCGARKQFNSQTLETKGSFYFPPVVKAERV